MKHKQDSKSKHKVPKNSFPILPYVHLAFINAIHLGPYALKPLESGSGRSAWQLSQAKLAHLPYRSLSSETKPETNSSSIPCVCLLPPRKFNLPKETAEALAPNIIRQQGLYPITLQDYSETALLQAILKGIEIFYPQAFRPDISIQALEKRLHHLEPQELSSKNGSTTNSLFAEEVGLPLAMRFRPEQLDRQQLLLAENLTSRQIHCYWLEGDAPLCSTELIEQLYHKHHLYAAEFSFSDIYPRGLVPILFQASALGSLWTLKKDFKNENSHHLHNNSGLRPETQLDIWEIAKRDLNLFAAEPLLCDKDYRLLRLDLRARNKRQYQTLKNIYNHFGTSISQLLFSTGPLKNKPSEPSSDPNISIDKILRWTEYSATSMRCLPRYFPIQISAFCPQRCSYCPYPKMVDKEFFYQTSNSSFLQQNDNTTFMPRPLWRKLLSAIVEFAGDGIINLSPLGEPLLHPEFTGLVQDLHEYQSLELIVETSGSYWKTEDIKKLPKSITWIVSIDALDPQLYQQLRAPDENILPMTGMTTSQQKAHALVDLLLESGHSVYVQAVRMQENKTDLEAFYHYWNEGRKPRNANNIPALAQRAQPEIFPKVLVQKYNSYAGLLPERQLLNLAPVTRFPCRRLAREMVFGLDGQTYLCVQDLQQKLSNQQNLGYFPQQNLEELWRAGQKTYQQHIEQKYPEFCKQCDEFYVYNF